MQNFKEYLINELVSYRKANKLSQQEFAEKIGVAQQVISKFERGEVDPRVTFIDKVIDGMKKVAVIKRPYRKSTLKEEN